MTRPLMEKFMRERCPTLEMVLDDGPNSDIFCRAVSGISLWRTAGTMADWECLDRFEFPTVALSA